MTSSQPTPPGTASAPVTDPASSPSSPTSGDRESGAASAPPVVSPVELGEESSPEALVTWGLRHFQDRKIVLTTSYGMEGCALMDICSKTIDQLGLPNLTVASIDTGFFFPETLQLREKLIARYSNLDFITWETSVSIEQQKEDYGDQLWKNNPNLCCNLRKVQPMKENVHRYDIWITAVRRSQTEHRANTPVLGWDWRYQLLKFCPLVTWSRPQVWQYIQDHNVPFNQLHLQNYPTIGCYHCTRPVPGSTPDMDAREGRWEGNEKTECGLHYSI